MVYWLTRLASWLAGKTPRPIRLAFAGAATTLVYYAWVSKRRVTIANMAQILGTSPADPRAQRLAQASWSNYGRYLSDFFHLPNLTSEEVLARMVDVSESPGAFPQLGRALEAGRGALIVTAHFGCWDLAGVLAASQHPLYVLVDTFTDKRMDDLIQGQRGHFGLRVLRAEKSPRPILRALKENNLVAIVADRPLSPGEGVPITFFGRRCYVPAGVAQLALLAGSPILVCFGFYDERYSPSIFASVEPPIIPEANGDREADVTALTQRVYSAIERTIRRHPDQWYMFRSFWPEASDDASDSEIAVSAAPAIIGNAQHDGQEEAAHG